MKQSIIHHDGAGSLGTAGTLTSSGAANIKIGLDVHQGFHVGVAQHDHGHPGPPRRFAPAEFVPWVRALLRAGHGVQVVHEACGLGFALCRELEAAGARCLVVAPQALDEGRTGIKNDPRDARALCLRLGRYLDGNRQAAARGRNLRARAASHTWEEAMGNGLTHERTATDGMG